MVNTPFVWDILRSCNVCVGYKRILNGGKQAALPTKLNKAEQLTFLSVDIGLDNVAVNYLKKVL